MSNSKKKTTIAFDADNWIKLQNIAAMQNSSPTQILNELLDSYVNDKLPEDYKERIEQQVHQALDRQIDRAFLRNIASRVAELLGDKTEVKAATNDSTPISVESIAVTSSDKADTDTTNTTSTTKDTQNDTTDTTSTTVADEVEKSKTRSTVTAKKDNTTSTTSTSKLSKQEKIQHNIAKFRTYKGSDNRKSYDDSYVATSEGINKQAVNRYRRGHRSPKQEFIDRWGLDWSGERWIKNVEGK